MSLDDLPSSSSVLSTLASSSCLIQRKINVNQYFTTFSFQLSRKGTSIILTYNSNTTYVYHKDILLSRLPCRDTHMQTKLFYMYLLSLHVYVGRHVCCCCVNILLKQNNPHIQTIYIYTHKVQINKLYV